METLIFDLDTWLEELTINEPDSLVLEFSEPVSPIEADYRAELNGM